MKKVLGKGLSALIPDSYASEIKERVNSNTPRQQTATENQSAFRLIPVSWIIPNQDQPRKRSDCLRTEFSGACTRRAFLWRTARNRPLVRPSVSHPAEFARVDR